LWRPENRKLANAVVIQACWPTEKSLDVTLVFIEKKCGFQMRRLRVVATKRNIFGAARITVDDKPL
jgi:hypothetical protein